MSKAAFIEVSILILAFIGIGGGIAYVSESLYQKLSKQTQPPPVYNGPRYFIGAPEGYKAVTRFDDNILHIEYVKKDTTPWGITGYSHRGSVIINKAEITRIGTIEFKDDKIVLLKDWGFGATQEDSDLKWTGNQLKNISDAFFKTINTTP